MLFAHEFNDKRIFLKQKTNIKIVFYNNNFKNIFQSSNLQTNNINRTLF